jgi:hypothetical protein
MSASLPEDLQGTPGLRLQPAWQTSSCLPLRLDTRNPMKRYCLGPLMGGELRLQLPLRRRPSMFPHGTRRRTPPQQRLSLGPGQAAPRRHRPLPSRSAAWSPATRRSMSVHPDGAPCTPARFAGRGTLCPARFVTCKTNCISCEDHFCWAQMGHVYCLGVASDDKK